MQENFQQAVAATREHLYWKLRKFSFRYAYFLFYDTPTYHADTLFIQHKVRVWFDLEYTKADSPYVAIFCHIRKKDTSRFLAALDDLKSSMMICGHPHYESEISQLMNNIEAHRRPPSDLCDRKQGNI